MLLLSRDPTSFDRLVGIIGYEGYPRRLVYYRTRGVEHLQHLFHVTLECRLIIPVLVGLPGFQQSVASNLPFRRPLRQASNLLRVKT